MALKWASPSKVALGCIAFCVWWVFAVFPKVPLVPIGRTAGSLLGGTLMVVFKVISPDEAFAAVDLPILGLLFGTMVISVYLERADLFRYLGIALSWRTRGGMDLLCRVCLLAALSSALFTNDTTCVILTGFVLELCREKNLHPKPFLLALACSSNIGSAATPIGNPQNLVIAINSRISFGRFLAGVLPAVGVGLAVNTLLLVVFYGRCLSLASGDSSSVEGDSETLESADVQNGRVKVSLMWITTGQNGDMSDHGEACQRSLSHQNSLGSSRQRFDSINHEGFPDALASNVSGDIMDVSPDRVEHESIELEAKFREQGAQHTVNSKSLFLRYGKYHLRTLGLFCWKARPDAGIVHKKGGIFKAFSLFTGAGYGRKGTAMLGRRFRASWRKHQPRIWKISVYLVTLGMLAALLAGLSLPWTAITAAVVMMIFDFSDAGPSLDKVSYALLVFFAGMFIATSGFNATGAPEQFWLAVEPHSQIDNASGVTVLSLVVTVLSNVVSNVPTVILLGPRVALSAAGTPGASSDKAWLILAWVSTVAGNLTLVGSAANIIVCEQARLTQAEKELLERQSNDLTGDSQGPARATYNLTFWNHLKFGFPSTLIVIAVGLFPIVLRKL